jgi:flagellar hook-associated protein FlgK
MAGQKFDSKSFNPEAFGSYIETLPQPNKNELIKSRVIVADATIKNLLSSQTGSYYATIPFFGRIGGDALNYDGKTDITATSMDTFEQSIVAIGRAKAWMEKDFSVEITAGVDFMSEVAKQVAAYWDDIDTGMIMSILTGIFSMTGEKNLEFVNNHTFDITGEVDNAITATTLNTAVQKASGDKRAKFTMVFMHSAVATNLENQNLLEFLKYTDANGVQRPLPMATWNGRLVIVDDGMPTETADGGTKYTTYVFGEGAFRFADLGAKVPYEMSRDPKTNGGQDTLYSRRRMCFAPYGISYTKASQVSLSPTDAELATGSNWKLIDNGESGEALKTVNHKDIAIARIISLG